MYTDVVKKLIEKNITISVMESCTGGLLSSRITDVEGVSAVFKGSIVAYSNEAKIAAGIPAILIEDCGVYSREVASAMAGVARSTYESNVSIGVTGTLGNTDPVNPEGATGVVYICIVRGMSAFWDKLNFDASSMSRMEAKAYVADKIFEKLDKIIDRA